MDAQKIIQLVHERDALVRKRESLVGDLDRKIQEIDDVLNQIGGRSNGVSVKPGPPLGGGLNLFPGLPNVGFSPPETLPSTNTAKLKEMIKQTPKLDYGAVARALYGEDSVDTRKRLRSLLSSMQTNKKIKNVGRNVWEVLR